MTLAPEERVHQRQQFDSACRKPRYRKEEFARWIIRFAESILIILSGSCIVTPIAIAENLPPANDIPEEILRAEIITEARSPIDGKPFSAIEFAEFIVRVETQLARDDAAEGVKTSPFKDVLFLLRVRNFLRSVGIPIK
jgi:hypothetical protein